MIAPVASAVPLPSQSHTAAAQTSGPASSFATIILDLSGPAAIPARIPVKQPVMPEHQAVTKAQIDTAAEKSRKSSIMAAQPTRITPPQVATVSERQPGPASTSAENPPNQADQTPDDPHAAKVAAPQSLPLPQMVAPFVAQSAPATHGQSGIHKTADKAARPSIPAPLAAPFALVPIPLPAPAPAIRLAPQEQAQGGDHRSGVAQTNNPQPAEQAPQSDVALQVNLKLPGAQAEPAPLPKLQALASAPEVAITPTPLLTTVPASTSAPAPIAATHMAQVSTRASETSGANQAPIVVTEPVESAKPAEPLKSVTLEFAPDGARDVRLRVSERAGEVHISLHSSDPSLTGKLHEGVHDLVGSLSRAGYDAEAWTPGLGHRGSNQQQEERKQPHVNPQDPDAEDFAYIYGQDQIQEVS